MSDSELFFNSTESDWPSPETVPEILNEDELIPKLPSIEKIFGFLSKLQ